MLSFFFFLVKYDELIKAVILEVPMFQICSESFSCCLQEEIFVVVDDKQAAFYNYVAEYKVMEVMQYMCLDSI